MIRVFADPEGLSHGAAELFAAEAGRAAAGRGRFSVALAGGATPRRTYELLASPDFRDRIPWGQVHVFWGDERCVPADDLRSNQRLAREALLDQVPLPAAQIHPMVCAGAADASALAYQRLLQDFFSPAAPRFDLILLGLGEDGHTASLFPGSGALEERERWVASVQKPAEPFARLTLTLPLLNRAALVVFLVSGAQKAAILARALTEKAGEGSLPVRRVRPRNGTLLWLADRAAAQLVPPQTRLR